MPKIFISSIILLIEGIRFVAYTVNNKSGFRGTKLSRFTGYLAQCRENCRGFVKLQYIFERAIEISRENFRGLSKIRENRESFVPRKICCYYYYYYY